MGKYKIVIAGTEAVPVIKAIVAITIKEIYPKYYSEKVVEFFLELHNATSLSFL